MYVCENLLKIIPTVTDAIYGKLQTLTFARMNLMTYHNLVHHKEKVQLDSRSAHFLNTQMVLASSLK